MDSVSILGVKVASITTKRVLEIIANTIEADQRGIITHVHVMGLNLAYEQNWFRDFLNHSLLVYCDGYGVKLGSMILGERLPERFTLADWIDQLAELSQDKNFSWFFLGNQPGSAEKSVELIRQQFPSLDIKGSEHGYFNKNKDHPDNKNIINKINRLDPDILFVGLGMPTQERWILENWDNLRVKIAITCGGLFDVLTGKNPRGPSLKNQFYFEWFARLFRYPHRYWQRYLFGNPLFLLRIFKQRFTGIETR